MRVCIIRNNEATSNAGIIRIMDALLEGGLEPLTLSRNRFNHNPKRRILIKNLNVKGHKVLNYEIQFPSEMGRGIRNILQLLIYQSIVLKWLITNARKYDAIHAFDLDAGMPALLASKILGKKIVYHIADFYVDSRHGIPKPFKKIIRWFEYLIISQSDSTILCTEERINQIKGSKPKNITIIHNSPVEDYQSIKDVALDTTDKNPSCLTICYVGSLTETRFINCAINVISKSSEYKLNIAGLGPLDAVVKKRSENISNISYFGRVDYSTALNMYKDSDVMFAIYDPNVPNHRYSAPNKVYEAMMLGKPIIVAKGTGIDKLVEKECMGITINYCEKEFDRALMFLKENPLEAAKMGENAKQAFGEYSWAKMKLKVQNLYKKIGII